MKKSSQTPTAQADLFVAAQKNSKSQTPLAERLRPQSFDDIIGQEKLVGPGGILRQLMTQRPFPSYILWGPPGSGKTSMAHAIAQTFRKDPDIAHRTRFRSLSALHAGLKDLREEVEKAGYESAYQQKATVIFIDEIHRFNKTQQDALLPHVEDGSISLIGATTENPSFEIIAPLLSRCRVFVLEQLKEDHLQAILQRALHELNTDIDPKASDFLLSDAAGDARKLLNTLEIAAHLTHGQAAISLEDIVAATQHSPLPYDKKGEAHYNSISAFIKSMRASNPDAAIYYLARMYEAGEDPRFLARRMIIFAAEDVGLADPQALSIAVSAMQAYEFVGQAEGWIPLAEAAIYLARAPKSNASYQAYKNAKSEISSSGSLPVPLQLRNAPTKLMKELNYGKGYAYAHSDPEGSARMECLPDALRGKKFFDENRLTDLEKKAPRDSTQNKTNKKK